MGKYCDPRILEDTWWSWLLASCTPELESVRTEGLLWTRTLGNHLEHRIVSTAPYSFTSIGGIIDSHNLDCAIKSSFFPLDLTMTRQAASDNFIKELPTDDTWVGLTSMIYTICCGVALNFHPPNTDVKNELIHEAFTHTLTKIRRGKLIFTPGKAPPFNLLTTAIFRVMYSIKNKEKRDRDRKSGLVEKIKHGDKLPNFNSLNVSRSLVGHGVIKT